MPRRPGAQPTQQRSKETVQRILDATAQLLGERGYSGLTTNHVAAEAGVSIGSLYRWFDDKGDLVEALRQRSSEQILEELSATLATAATLPPRQGVSEVLASLVEQLRVHRSVVGALLADSPMGAHQNLLPGIERQLAGFVRVFVLRHAPELSETERETRIHLALGIALGACLRVVFDRPGVVDADRMLEMTAELLTLGLSVPGPG
ncbi:hypothetical protein ASG90_02730 [Nocardioides sp. Soil797]|nr:hypothetical protein ASG90_02730 [Nocardioides sp. Soil797]